MATKVLLVFTVGIICLLVPAVVTGGVYDFNHSDSSRWSPFISTGFDATIHTYSLATEDTTETISEFRIQAGIEGHSKRKTAHRWRLRAEASTGSEMYRERLEGSYRFLSKGSTTRLRLKGYLWGRQYKENSTYSLSSDNYEGRFDARLYPLLGKSAALELRGWSSVINYKTPSTLEADYRDLGLGAFVRSQGFSGPLWSCGVRAYNRDYPDTTAIGRDVFSIEGDYESMDERGRGLTLFHKSERRLAADESIRPSAWTHWTDFEVAAGAGSGLVFLELQSESWSYDEETTAYFNSLMVDGKLGYRGGDILGTTWYAGFSGENMDAGESPESYAQFGFLGGLESYNGNVSGSVSLEYGRRLYDDPVITLEDDLNDESHTSTITIYSDFNYWKIWFMGSWFITDNFSLDAMASYEPESHTEQDDDSALGFGSIRLTWRP